jgi:DNA polymerase
MRDPEELASLVAAAKRYFEARLSAGETSIVLGHEMSTGSTKSDPAAERAYSNPTKIDYKGDPVPEGAYSNPVKIDYKALAELEKTAKVCVKCPLHKSRTQVVFGSGSGKSGLVFVGEAPGRDEDIQGVPFVGRAGQLLTRIIEAIKFDRGDVYITNVVKCRPEANRDPLPFEVETCSPYLAGQLEILKPRVICALGRFAAEALSGAKLPMSEYRHAELFFRGTRVFATYHPAACLRNPDLKKLVWEDVQKLREFWQKSR